MKDETQVFQWLKEQNAPFGIQLQILQAFQLYKVIVEMDKKLMMYEEREYRRECNLIPAVLLSVVLYLLEIQVHSLFQSYKSYYVVKDCIDKNL